MNETNSSFPNPREETAKPGKAEKSLPAVPLRGRVSILNIGQLLFLAFLFVMLLFQSINIYAGKSDNPADIMDISGENGEASVEKSNMLEENAATSSGLNTTGGGTMFILGEYEGKLAVLNPDRKTVYEVFDVYINTLPEYDKNLLSDGIEVQTQEELLSLLEDYSS